MSQVVLLQKKQRHEESWRSSYQYFPRLINSFKLETGAELGVAFGGHCEAILSTTQVSKLYGVDSYQHIANYHDPMNLAQADFDDLYKDTLTRLSGYGTRFELIRHDTVEAVNYVPSQLDFVYIDADHSFEGVWDDLQAWFNNIRPYGLIGGHDYDHPDFPGVKLAVDKFFSRMGWNVNLEGDGVWWVQKLPVGISFFIPAYNCEKTILETVNSIVNGNLSEEDEIVIVDDGSTDGTANILDEIAFDKPFVKVINHTRNKGGAAARNTAIENTKNNILFCLDSDNVLAPGSIRELLAFLMASGSNIACFNEVRYFKSTDPHETTHRWVYKEQPYLLTDYFSGHVNPGSSGNYMFTKQSWQKTGGYPEFAGALDTWGFGFYQLMAGYEMAIMPGSYYFHRYGHESYWTSYTKTEIVSIKALQIILPFLHIFEKSSIAYVLNPRHMRTWYDKLEKHPLRVKNSKKGKNGLRIFKNGLSRDGFYLTLMKAYRFLNKVVF